MEMYFERLQSKSVLTHTTQRTAILYFKTRQIKEDTLLGSFLFFFHHLLSFRLDFLPPAAAAT